MEELNSSNVLEFWKKATIEEQRENIDRVLEIIDSNTVLEMWKATKDGLKYEKPNLIIRIIKEKLNNGKTYIMGLWGNTPNGVQMLMIESVWELYRSELMIKKIWKETHADVKECKKESLAKALNYDEKLLRKYDILEYKPAPSGMLGKKEIDDIVWGLMQLQSDENSPYNQAEAKSLLTQKIPTTSIPYFFKQIAEELPESYAKMFWNSLEKDSQYKVIEEVLRKLKSKELSISIWNEFDSETQKRKIKELVKNNNMQSARGLVSMTRGQTNREILKEMIEENESNIDGIWGSFPEEIQLEYFRSVIEMSSDEEINDYIWKTSAEQVQRNNFSQMLQEKNDNIELIIEMMKSTKLPKAEIIGYILERYEGKVLEEIVSKYSLDTESLELLKGKISPEVSRKIVIRNASELSTEKLKELSESFNITSIQMLDIKGNLDSHQMEAYDIETYKKCREAIDQLLEGIDFSQQIDNPNREKIIFAEVIKRLANHISYDYESYEKIDKNEPVSNDCTNLVGGLLKNTCVCSGYAEIVRNVFSCCGIEVRYISGSNIQPNEHGHAWNQIKLDGIWYNMDLTWDRDRIIAGDMPQYLLRSDEEFLGHDKYDTECCKKEKCTETVSCRDIQWYLYKKLEIPKTIRTSVRRTRRRRVEGAYDMIAASQEIRRNGSEKGEEQWIN